MAEENNKSFLSHQKVIAILYNFIKERKQIIGLNKLDNVLHYNSKCIFVGKMAE